MLKTLEIILCVLPGRNYPFVLLNFKRVPLSICIERQITSRKAAYRPENQVFEMDDPETRTKKDWSLTIL